MQLAGLGSPSYLRSAKHLAPVPPYITPQQHLPAWDDACCLHSSSTQHSRFNGHSRCQQHQEQQRRWGCSQTARRRFAITTLSAAGAAAAISGIGSDGALEAIAASPPTGASVNVFGRWVRWWTLQSPNKSAEPDARPELQPLVRKLWQLCTPDANLLISAAVLLVLAAACELTIPAYATKAIFAAAQQAGPELHTQHLKTLTALVVGYGVFASMRGYCFSCLNIRMTRRLRTELFAALIRRPIEFFDSIEVGQLTSRLQADCQAMTKCIATNLNIILRNGLQCLGGIGYLFYLSPKLCGITLAISAILWGVTLFYGDWARKAQSVSQDVLAASNTVAEEVMHLNRVVRTFGTEAREEARYGSWLNRLYEVGLRQATGYSLFVMTGHITIYATKVAALVVGCTMVLNGVLTAEELTTFLFYIEFVTYCSLNVCDEYTELMEAFGASERVVKLLAAQPAPQIAGGQPLPNFSGRVDLQNVSFSYASRPDHVALQSVNLSFLPGKLTALVGLSGSGKTTVVALLQRLYDPTAGAMLVDGIDLRTVAAGDYRRQIGVVAQEPRLFAATVAENIAYGCDGLDILYSSASNPVTSTDDTYYTAVTSSSNGSISTLPDSHSHSNGLSILPVSSQFPLVTPSDVEAAARAANAHDFIMKLPQGYATPVTDKLLSGGQKQRIALARALVRKPRLLVLDEATSALDAESESQVQAALDRAMAERDRTVVVIAHRLSTVRKADVIVVMDKGSIIEKGSHEGLLRRRGAYWKLVQRQQYGIDPHADEGARSDLNNQNSSGSSIVSMSDMEGADAELDMEMQLAGGHEVDRLHE